MLALFKAIPTFVCLKKGSPLSNEEGKERMFEGF
jgi:hypothetical protein